MLLFFSVVIIISAVFLLNITEGGLVPHPLSRDLELKILFETVSAYATVGLSLGLTGSLTVLPALLALLNPRRARPAKSCRRVGSDNGYFVLQRFNQGFRRPANTG